VGWEGGLVLPSEPFPGNGEGNAKYTQARAVGKGPEVVGLGGCRTDAATLELAASHSYFDELEHAYDVGQASHHFEGER